jgi:tryptophan-rich sensory protein
MNKQLFVDLVSRLQWIDRIVVGVWIGLSILMLVAAGMVYSEKGINREFWLIVALLIASWTYPFYTLGFKLVPGLIGNIGYLTFTFFVINQIKPASAPAAYLLYPITLWVAMATVYVILQILARP